MNKLKRQWYRADIILPKTISKNPDESPAIDIPSDKPTISQTAETVPSSDKPQGDGLRQKLLKDLSKFKHDGLYEEALASIQTILDLCGSTSDLIYEMADIHFLMDDCTGCYSWLQKFIAAAPLDARGSLLMAHLMLKLDQRDDAVNFLNKLLNQTAASSYSEFTDEKYFTSLDDLIEKLKRALKAEKLLRRCPKLADYDKMRRRMKRSDSQNTLPANTKGGVIMSDILVETVSHIWDMQRAGAQDMDILLSAKPERISDCVFCQVLSYKKKLWLFNYLAGALYHKGKIDTAIHLLRQAMLLDDENDITLKNLGYLLCQKGEYSAAKAVLSDIAVKDFAVEDMLKKCHTEL